MGDTNDEQLDSEPEWPINGALTNGRLRHRSREGEPSVVQMGEMKLGRWFWVGGRLYVTDDEVRFAGIQLVLIDRSVGLDDLVRIDYAVAVPAHGIESVRRRTGVVGVPYVAMTTSCGAEVQFRTGVAGSKSDLVVETIQALIDSR